MNAYKVTVYEQDGEVGLVFIDGFVINIIQDVNRLNNPEDTEIIDTYVFYNYGNKALSNYESIESVIIGGNWNIENYK